MKLPPVDVSYVKEFSEEEIESRQYSMLDLCPFNSFTLLVGSRSQWARDGRFRTLDVSLKSLGVKICLWVAGEDYDFVDEKYADMFATKANFGSGGGLLVRPDQHLLRVVQPDDEVDSLRRPVLVHLAQ